MSRLRHTLIAIIGLLSPILLFGQFPNALATDSVDPQKDSAVFAAMRCKMDSIRSRRPTVALVLSGGGAKGACHIGVLEYLEEKGVPVDMVVGTSMGALIGGLYGVGYDGASIDSIISGLDWSKIMSDERSQHSERRSLFSSVQSDGYLYGDNVYGLLAALTAGYQDSLSFKDLPVPFFCVATDILTTKSVNWGEGHLLDALRSSMSLPVVFKPLRKEGRVMVDGGMRNNFPVDIARAMGADIIIGVDVGARTKMESLDNMAGIVVESLSSMGLDAYRVNRENTDIFIRPQMEPYGTMSWANDNIDTLIRRGYAAAVAVTPQLDSVLSVTGNGGRRLSGRAAEDLRDRRFAVSTIAIEGVSDKETRYFSHKCSLKPGIGKVAKLVGMNEINEVIADLYGSGAFKSVTYRLLGKKEPYSLVFVCEKAPKHQGEMSIRIDTEEAVSLFVGASLWSDRICGSYLDVNVKASMNPQVEAEYTYRSIAGPTWGASSKIHFMHCLSDRIWHNDNRIFIENPNRRTAYWKAGGRFQPSPGTFSTFAEGGCDSRNDKLFPTRGVKAFGGYEYAFGRGGASAGSGSGSGSGKHIVSIGVEGAFQCGKLLTILPSFNARTIFGETSDLPYFMKNYVGGAMPGRYFEQQIAFSGMNGIRECAPLTAVAACDFRIGIFKNFYIDASAQALAEALSFSQYKGSLWGATLGASYRSIAGPLSFYLNWNSETHTVGAYLGLGFEF